MSDAQQGTRAQWRARPKQRGAIPETLVMSYPTTVTSTDILTQIPD